MISLVFLMVALGIMLFPMLIPYLLLGHMAVQGIASSHFMSNLKVSVGGINIFPPDLLYAASLFLAVFGLFRLLLTGRLRTYAPLSKAAIFFIVCYFIFFIGKLVNGYFENVPLDTLVRSFASDTQCVYLFLPLFYLKQEKTLKQLLYFVVILTLIFPLLQPFLYGSSDQVALQQGQGGTLRLGFGNANILLMLGVFAFFVWERKLWLSALPLAGIAMLAMRSAFVSLGLCIIVLSFLKKKSIKYIAMMALVGVFLVATLVIIQSTSSVPVLDKAAERIALTFEYTGTTKARWSVIPMAFEAFVERPLVGFSYNDMQTLAAKQSWDAFSFNMLHPHNFVLSSIVRTGFIGSLLLFCIIGMSMIAALRLSRQQETNKQGIYLFSTILFFVTYGVMNTSFFSAGYVFWLLAGICFWYLNQAHNLKSQQRVNLLKNE